MSNELPYTEAARREIAQAAASKLQRYVDEIAEAAEEVEHVTGVPIVRRPRAHILDARRAELEHLRRQAEAWLLAAAVIDKWMLPDDHRSLGDVCKTMPRDELRELRRALRSAGALHDGGTP